MYTRYKVIYYCDFCHKYRLSKRAMQIHESHCTLNPSRICRMWGCVDGSCPICLFSKARLSGKMPEGDLQAEIKKWYQVKEIEGQVNESSRISDTLSK